MENGGGAVLVADEAVESAYDEASAGDECIEGDE